MQELKNKFFSLQLSSKSESKTISKTQNQPSDKVSEMFRHSTGLSMTDQSRTLLQVERKATVITRADGISEYDYATDSSDEFYIFENDQLDIYKWIEERNSYKYFTGNDFKLQKKIQLLNIQPWDADVCGLLDHISDSFTNVCDRSFLSDHLEKVYCLHFIFIYNIRERVKSFIAAQCKLFVQADRISFSVKRGETIDNRLKDLAKKQSINIYEYQILLYNLAKFIDPSNATSVPIPIFRPNMGEELSGYFLSAIATQKAINQTNRLPTTPSEKAQALELMCTELKSQNKSNYVAEIRVCKKLRNFIIGYAKDISIFEIEAELKQIDATIKFDQMIKDDVRNPLHTSHEDEFLNAIHSQKTEVSIPPCKFCGGKVDTNTDTVFSTDSSQIGMETPLQISEDFVNRMHEHLKLIRPLNYQKYPATDISQFFKERQDHFSYVIIPEYKNLLKYRFEANFNIFEFQSFSESFNEMNLFYEYFPQHTTGVTEKTNFDRLLPTIFRDKVTSSNNNEQAAAIIPDHISDCIYIDVDLATISYTNEKNSGKSDEKQSKSSKSKEIIDDESKSCLAYIGSDISLIKEVLIPDESIKFVRNFHSRHVWRNDDTLIELVKGITLECKSGPCEWTDTFYIIDEEDMPNFEIVLGKTSLESLKFWKFLSHFKESDLNNTPLQLP